MVEMRDVFKAEGARIVEEAITNGRVGLLIQDISAVDDFDKILYGECLARLGRPDGRVYGAAEFISCLEALGAVSAFDQHVVGLVLDKLDDDPDLVLSCNLSADNLRNHAQWDAIAGQIRLRPHLAGRLVLELTETQALQNVSFAATMIAGIRHYGCRVALDDFGTGSATPELLQLIDFDIIKIDRLFLHKVRRSTDGFDSIRHLVGFASCFAPTVVVEGVETAAQVAHARTAGATHVQGHFISIPNARDHAAARRQET